MFNLKYRLYVTNIFGYLVNTILYQDASNYVLGHLNVAIVFLI